LDAVGERRGDYWGGGGTFRDFGLSGELAAVCLEAGLRPSFARVAVDDTIPYARHLEDETLPIIQRISEAVRGVAGA